VNKRNLPPPVDESEWARLVEVERRLEAEIAAARTEAARRVAAARVAPVMPDPATLEALAAEEERVDAERHRAALARLDADADALVQRLAAVPAERIDALARWTLDAAIAGSADAEAP
jgi:hypothetical protein